MGQKRMFSLCVVDTDKFMDMPCSTQALYFHLGMHGDDDGFVSSPRKIQRAAGCSDDDLRLLAAKGFIIPFESGVIVITDWRINNTLKNDRYRETIYKAERAMLQIEASGKYALNSSVVPECFQNGSDMVPQHNITKPNLTEHNQTEQNKINGLRSCADVEAVSLSGDAEFHRFWTAYPKRIGKKAARKAFDKAIKATDIDTLLAAIKLQKQSPQWTKDNGQYIPNPATWLNQGRWDDETEVKTNGQGKRSDFEGLKIGTVI